MKRSLWKAGALFTLGLLLVPSVFAHSPARGKGPKSKLAVDPMSPVSGESKLGASATPDVDTSTIPTAPETEAQPADKKKGTISSPELKPDPKFLPMPATTGTLGLFTAETGDTLPKGGFSFSASGNKFGRIPGSVTILQIGVDLAFGVTDRFNIYAAFDPYGHTHVGNQSQLSFAPQNSFNFPYQNTIFPTIPATGTPGYVEDFPFASANGGGLGNVTVGFKYGLLSERLGDPVSVSIRNELVISSQTELAKLIANGTQGSPLTYLMSLAMSKRWSNVITTTFNMGYAFTRDPRDLNGGHAFQIADQFRTSAGFIMFPESRFQPMAEYSSILFSGGTPNTAFGPRDPVDGVWGLRMYLCKYFAADIGYRYMLNLRQLNDRHGFVVKLGTAYWPEQAKALPANHPPTVSVSADKNMIYPGSGDAVTIKALASDSDNDPLTYTWSAKCGHIDGDGPQVRWLSAGTTTGTCSVTVKVDDGRGGFASSSMDIRIEPKPNR
jgi:hypothetical protein